MAENAQKIVRVGIIGCGEVAQIVHIPNLLYMSSWFRVTYLCDVSPASVAVCQAKIPGPEVKTTRDTAELCASSDVDLVMVINSDEYHSAHAISALQNDKHVLIEKPLALTKRDVYAVIEAEKKSKGRVMVGYMRRYAAPFEDAVKEIGGMGKILYARVRDIIGQNSFFTSQSGTFPQYFTDFTPEDSAEKKSRAEEMVKTAFQDEIGISVTDDSTRMWRFMGSLASHDLSLMREALGMPQKVVGSSLNFPFWNALFQYPGYTVSYESGIHNIPGFDAHLEVYSADKSVRVQYQTPYVKGLPVTIHIAENSNGELKETTIRKSYEDPYTKEMKQLYSFVVDGAAVKTTAQDALQDLEVSGMIMKHAYASS